MKQSKFKYVTKKNVNELISIAEVANPKFRELILNNFDSDTRLKLTSRVNSPEFNDILYEGFKRDRNSFNGFVSSINLIKIIQEIK